MIHHAAAFFFSSPILGLSVSVVLGPFGGLGMAFTGSPSGTPIARFPTQLRAVALTPITPAAQIKNCLAVPAPNLSKTIVLRFLYCHLLAKILPLAAQAVRLGLRRHNHSRSEGPGIQDLGPHPFAFRLYCIPGSSATFRPARRSMSLSTMFDAGPAPRANTPVCAKCSTPVKASLR